MMVFYHLLAQQQVFQEDPDLLNCPKDHQSWSWFVPIRKGAHVPQCPSINDLKINIQQRKKTAISIYPNLKISLSS